MTGHGDDVSSSKGPNAAILFGYALTGAALATLAIASVEMMSSPQDAPAASSSSPPARACPLSASPVGCDTCMLQRCAEPCNACAANPDCLRLFSCIMDCKDAACEAACARNHPDGKKDLVAFLGEGGCLVERCPVACP